MREVAVYEPKVLEPPSYYPTFHIKLCISYALKNILQPKLRAYGYAIVSFLPMHIAPVSKPFKIKKRKVVGLCF